MISWQKDLDFRDTSPTVMLMGRRGLDMTPASMITVLRITAIIYSLSCTGHGAVVTVKIT
jgi:hypothetical protein